MDVWSSQHVAGVGYSWHVCGRSWIFVTWLSVAGVRYSWHGCLVVTAHGRSFIFVTWMSSRHSTRAGVGYSWHGWLWQSWLLVTWPMSGRHSARQELESSDIDVWSSQNVAGVENYTRDMDSCCHRTWHGRSWIQSKFALSFTFVFQTFVSQQIR